MFLLEWVFQVIDFNCVDTLCRTGGGFDYKGREENEERQQKLNNGELVRGLWRFTHS